jgi:hypothetical protein
MHDLKKQILQMFAELNTDRLDLHALLEAGGNDPNARDQVIDAVAQLVNDGALEELGSDFYRLTGTGRKDPGVTIH